MKKPVWVVVLVIIAAGIGLANFGELIPTAHKIDRWAGLFETLIMLALGLFGYPVVGRGASVAFVEDDEKKPPISGAAIALVLAAAGMLLAASGCATARSAAVGTKHAVSESVAKAAVDFAKYDGEHQLEIVAQAASRDAARAELQAWRTGPQAKILKAFDGVTRAVELLSAALKAADAGIKQDWVALTVQIVNAAHALTEALKEFGVPVPFTVPALSRAADTPPMLAALQSGGAP